MDDIFRSFKITFLCITFIQFAVAYDVNSTLEHHHNTLFGNGKFTDQVRKQTLHYFAFSPFTSSTIFRIFQSPTFSNHKSSSTEDLKILFQAEKEAVCVMNQVKYQLNNNTKLVKTIDEYQRYIDYNM